MGFADVVYVPASAAPTYIELSRLFMRHHVWEEIALPTILACLEAPVEVRRCAHHTVPQLQLTLTVSGPCWGVSLAPRSPHRVGVLLSNTRLLAPSEALQGSLSGED